MAITNGYATLAEVKAALRIGDTAQDAAIEVAVEAASREIDGVCRRHFYDAGSATARVYVADSHHRVGVHDFSTTTGLVVETDSAADGTWSTTWAASDYQLEPLNGRRGGEAWPYECVRAVGSYTFPIASDGQALVRVTARWGWASVPLPVKQACIIQSVSLFKGADAPLGVAGFGDVGAISLRQALHPQAVKLVEPYMMLPGVA